MNLERSTRQRDVGAVVNRLTPEQQRALDKLERVSAATAVTAVLGNRGAGKSTILTAYSEKHGGHLVRRAEIMRAISTVPPERTDAAIYAHFELLASRYDVLLFDDFSDLMEVCHIGFPTMGYRNFHFARFLVPLMHKAVAKAGKTLILSGRPLAKHGSVPDHVDWLYGSSQVALVNVEDPRVQDYACVATNILGEEVAAAIDFQRVFDFASALNCHQISIIARLLAKEASPSTESFIAGLSDYFVRANTHTEEVEELSFDGLPGSEEIIAKLETHVVLPLENQELASRLELRPKRGVLLYGPPGTGKTSIGRALAHRMQGKFFLIDGSVLTDWPGTFFARVRGIIEEAKANAPAVVFIDDADVLFTIPHIAGFPRYLLSLLDGMESETAGKVCVMMTAMDASKVPEALLRSGRVELWLETRLPDERIRAEILKRWMTADLPDADAIDYAALAAATEGRTPADLRRLVGDAKSLYAADRVRGKPPLTASQYMDAAVAQSVITRQRMGECLQPDAPAPNAQVEAVNGENFEREVLESNVPVLVDFWAPWCGPCLTMAPLLDDLARQVAGRVKVVKLNCEENPELANQYQVRSIPRLALFRDGQIAIDHTGTAGRVELETLLLSALPELGETVQGKSKYGLGIGGMAETGNGCKVSGW